jgi:hypothetical protein
VVTISTAGCRLNALSINVWFLNRLHSLFKKIRYRYTELSLRIFDILNFLSYIDQFCSISAIYSISHEWKRKRCLMSAITQLSATSVRSIRFYTRQSANHCLAQSSLAHSPVGYVMYAHTTHQCCASLARLPSHASALAQGNIL